jgi:hypothetical protein
MNICIVLGCIYKSPLQQCITHVQVTLFMRSKSEPSGSFLRREGLYNNTKPLQIMTTTGLATCHIWFGSPVFPMVHG